MAFIIPTSMFSSPIESTTPSPTPLTTDHPETPFADQPTYSSSTHTTSEHSPSNAALISGLAVTAFIVILSICAICWFARHKIAAWWRGGRSRPGPGREGWNGDGSESVRLKSVDNTPSTIASEWEVRREHPPPPLPATTKASTAEMARSASTSWTRNDLRSNSTAPSQHGHDVGHGFSVPGFPSHSKTPRAAQPRAGAQSQRTLNHETSSLPRIVENPATAHELDATPSPRPQSQALSRAYLNRSLPASPSISSMPLPITPATTAETTASSTSTVGAQTLYDQKTVEKHQPAGQRPGPAYTPSIYQPYPPTSLPHPRAIEYVQSHPALLTPGAYTPPQPFPHSFSTLASPPPSTTANQGITIAPSPPPPWPTIHTTTTDPTTSNPLTATLPPSMPHPASTISLGSTASLYRRLDSSIDLYRGLSFQRSPQKSANAPAAAGEAGAMRPVERPPWDYLSAEDAVGGGWRNSTGTVAGSVEGWETIREEDEGEEGAKEKEGKGAGGPTA